MVHITLEAASISPLSVLCELKIFHAGLSTQDGLTSKHITLSTPTRPTFACQK